MWPWSSSQQCTIMAPLFWWMWENITNCTLTTYPKDRPSVYVYLGNAFTWMEEIFHEWWATFSNLIIISAYVLSSVFTIQQFLVFLFFTKCKTPLHNSKWKTCNIVWCLYQILNRIYLQTVLPFWKKNLSFLCYQLYFVFKCPLKCNIMKERKLFGHERTYYRDNPNRLPRRLTPNSSCNCRHKTLCAKISLGLLVKRNGYKMRQIVILHKHVGWQHDAS